MFSTKILRSIIAVTPLALFYKWACFDYLLRRANLRICPQLKTTHDADTSYSATYQGGPRSDLPSATSDLTQQIWPPPAAMGARLDTYQGGPRQIYPWLAMTSHNRSPHAMCAVLHTYQGGQRQNLPSGQSKHLM